MRLLKAFLLTFSIVCAVAITFVYKYASQQGRETVNPGRANTDVTFDPEGIPTIDGNTWQRVIETEGFVVAADRLFQMDLTRRSGAGRLSEWFGENARAIAWDENRKQEDWESVAAKAVEELPALEREFCELYARGVNRFIRENPRAWGVEYLLLGETPQPWRCQDTLLVLLSMVADLSETTDEEAAYTVWYRRLPVSWQQFLYPQDHAWNKPLFGSARRVALEVKPEDRLPRQPLDPAEAVKALHTDQFFPGSNAWVHRNSKTTLVANDPHLSASVPQLWYPVRLRVDQSFWAAGVTIPGLPGIVLGRNREIAWGFTNAKEDVDDLLEEEISKDGLRYVAQERNGKKEWREIEKRPYTVRVKGGTDRTGTALFTHRGPLRKAKYLGEGLYSRQWIGFKPGTLRLPMIALAAATDWESFNRAMDDFPAPAQSIVFGDKRGGIGVRVSGRGIRRKRSGLMAQPALKGEWEGIESPSQRPRFFIPPGKDPRSLSTANQRLFVSKWGEHWSSDLRQDRIQTLLSAKSEFTRSEMESLQRDVHSRYFVEFLGWVAKHSTPTNSSQEKILNRWRKWDGFADSDERVFAQAVYARALLMGLLIGRVRKAFLTNAEKEVPYQWKMENAWELTLLRKPSSLSYFGLENKEVAQWLLEQSGTYSGKATGYSHANRWTAQHPFALTVPLIGRLFAVDEHPQVGYDGLVRVERPKAGASTRLVWDLRSDDGGSWSFPVGQSGHFLSKYYSNFRKKWFNGKTTGVLPREKNNTW